MAINTEWLWTPHDHHVDGSKFNKGDMSKAAYAEEVSFYTSIILANKAEIVALSEIENEMVANDLARKLGSKWRAYFKQGRDTATGQDVAILSNLELVADSVTDFNFPSGRISGSTKQKRLSKVLGVRFDYVSDQRKKQQIGIITAHFLSKRNDNKNKSQNRQRQARALVKTFAMSGSDTSKLVVLGDFNDFINSPTIRILLKQGQLQSAEVGIVNPLSGPNGSQTNDRSKSVDHILYRNLKLLEYQRIDLKSYSDHFAVYARFR